MASEARKRPSFTAVVLMGLVMVVAVVYLVRSSGRGSAPSRVVPPPNVGHQVDDTSGVSLSSAADKQSTGSLPSREPLQDSRAVPSEIESAPRDLAFPFRGRLIDASTEEPIPEYLIQVRGPRGPVRETPVPDVNDQEGPSVTVKIELPPKRVEDVVTDADGRFQTTGAFEEGVLDLLLIDDRPQSSLLGSLWKIGAEEVAIEHEHSFDGGQTREAVLPVAIGPTYRLDLDLPAGLRERDFFACFPEPRSGSPANVSANRAALHRMIAEDPGAPFSLFMGGAASAVGLGSRAALREGDPRWVRFSSPVLSVERDGRGGPFELGVRSRDGLWSGSAFVTSVQGNYPGPVSIDIVGRGAVTGVVQDSAGTPIPTAWVRLYPAGSNDSLLEIGADSRGRFAFDWLESGDYEIRIETDRYQTWTATVTIKVGKTEDLAATLAGKGALGRIAGVCRGRTGHHRSKGGIVLLASLSNPSFFLLKSVSYRGRPGEYEAPFAFEDIPAGEYELTVRPLDNMEWNTRRMVVSPPAEGLEFVCEDDVPLCDLGFRAVDDATGQPIAKSWTLVWLGDPMNDVRLDADWESGLYRGVPAGASLRWVLHAEGYRLAMGDESAFRPEGETRMVEVRLARGWGQVFKVTTNDGETPLAGVELVADGSTIGHTDARGILCTNLDSMPRQLDFRLEGWRVSWGRTDPSEADFEWGPETPVHLSRDDE